jgi:hypothetical protein
MTIRQGSKRREIPLIPTGTSLRFGSHCRSSSPLSSITTDVISYHLIGQKSCAGTPSADAVLARLHLSDEIRALYKECRPYTPILTVSPISATCPK